MVAEIFVPSVRQRRVAIELRQIRRAAAMEIGDAADLYDAHVADVAVFENCLRPIPPDRLRQVMEHGYRIDDEDYLSYFHDLALHGDQRGWVEDETREVPGYQRMYTGLERAAVAQWIYSPIAIPPIFQTRDY